MPERARRPGRRSPRAGAGDAPRQQVVVSGVGGQGVLFVARLLAEAAMARELPVLASETHGMAQRGGTVIAHLKVGPFSSPLVRPGRADVLILLKEENAALHRSYLRPGGWAAVNARSAPAALAGAPVRTVDADALARETGLGKAVNLIVLGRALAASVPGGGPGPGLFCTPAGIRAVLRGRMAGQGTLLEASLAALELGLTQTIPARR
ncbi:MAG: 2-oxoacid:acceptor oxidoreductase family protein [Gemmatimonadota bacterium]